MFARVTTIEGPPERLAEGARVIREQVIPAAQAMRGFKGGYWLADRQAGKALGVTLWEDEEALQASEAMAEQARERTAQLGASLLSIERYEVIAQA